MNRRPEPFDADERTLAELLARDALPGPSPQLDARILAAARAATATPGRASQRLRPRWIAGMSIAATLVLAVGIAWRLRPLPPQRPAVAERPAPVAVSRTMEAAGESSRPLPASESATPQPQAPKQVTDKPIPLERERAAPVPQESPAEPPVAYDKPSPKESAAPPPAPPPPPPPPAQVATPKPAMNAMAAPATAATQAAQAQRRADSHDQAKSLDRVEVSGSRLKARAPASTPQAFPRDAAGLDAAAAADAAASGETLPPRALLDEEPPATADSPLVRDAWLQRIRELLAAGDTEAARGSLAEFRRRYPNYALPEDLQPLAKP